MALFRQKQIVESDDDVGEICELHKVWSDDVDPVRPGPLGFNPGHDSWEVPRVTGQERHKQYHQHPEGLQCVWVTSRTTPGNQSLYSRAVNNDISLEVQNEGTSGPAAVFWPGTSVCFSHLWENSEFWNLHFQSNLKFGQKWSEIWNVF